MDLERKKNGSLQSFILNPLINVTIAFLIISGGLGFSVWMDLLKGFKNYLSDKPQRLSSVVRHLSNQSRIILYTTGIVLLLGTGISWFMEFGNARTIANYNIFQQLMISFFQTVTMRTAGFATINYLDTHTSTNLVYMIQMIIGGAPGGTAGGVKVTTVAMTFLLFKAELSGQSEVTFRHRIIDNRTIKQTLTVLIFFFSVLVAGYILLLQFEPALNPIALLFESISAMATVGVSMDLTPQLSTMGRIIIMILMFIGRVGPITVLLSLLQKKEKTIRYAKTNITVG